MAPYALVSLIQKYLGFLSHKLKIMAAIPLSQSPEILLTAEQIEKLTHDSIEPRESWFHRWFPFMRWTPSSPDRLKEAEDTLMSYVKTKSIGKYVEVNLDVDNESSPTKCRIWTRIFNIDSNYEADSPSTKLPLVMIHGMGAGLAFYALNFDELAKNRTVYAIDLPGFARSSRCKFNSKPEEAEKQYVRAIEDWRQKVGIGKMCLLGHSFGGYLSSAYALKYPEHVSHLILADPWGFPEKPQEVSSRIPWSPYDSKTETGFNIEIPWVI
jgi:hypothetical protein